MHRALAWLFLIALAVGSGCTDEETQRASSTTEPVISAGTYKRAPCPAGSGPTCVDMYIVAHEDDDMLFMNPDIEQSIQRGNNVIVVFTTAGQVEPPCGWSSDLKTLAWTDRERGILDAYSTMTATTDPWTASSAPVLGGTKHVAMYKRPIGPQYPGSNVTLYFFRFEDGGFLGWEGAPEMNQLDCSTHCPGNNEVIDGKTVTGSTNLATTQFTQTEIINVLEDLMKGNTTPPTPPVDSVSTLDATVINYAGTGGPDDTGTDYQTHLATGLSAVAAYMKYQSESPNSSIHLRTYRGYSATQEFENLSADQAMEKSAVFGHYASWDCVSEHVTDSSGDTCSPGASATPCGSATSKGFGESYDCLQGAGCTRTTTPDFQQHWARTYSTRSLAGPAALKGRLAYGAAGSNLGCVGLVGATAVTPVSATASSTESASYPASAAIDNNGSTRWSSASSDPQSLVLDLGSSQYITQVVLAWEAAYGKAYQIQVSDDNSHWVTAFSTTIGQGGTVTIPLPGATKGRYVRMYGTQRGTAWGYSLWQMTVYTYQGVGATTSCAGATPWTFTANHQIQLTGTAQCLEASASGAISLASCTHVPLASTFVLLSNGQIQSNPNVVPSNTEGGTTFIPAQCLSVAGTLLSVQSCAKSCINETTGGQVNCEFASPICTQDTDCSPGNTCRWTEYGQRCLSRCDPDNSACASQTQVCIADVGVPHQGVCMPRPGGTPTPLQNWSLLFDATSLMSTEFSDATEVDSASTYYRTFAIGNQNVCARKIGGLYCAAYSGGALQPAQLLDSTFNDSAGWTADENGSTVSGVWDPTALPSGRTMGCGRGYYGAQCGGLLASDFNSVPSGWNSGPYYYDSIRYVDVTGDKKPDICGRGYWGIQCSMNQTSSFSSASLWTSSFDQSHGWNTNGVGDTIQFGDINGDGKTDVCGRSSAGVDCALGTNSSFVSYHPWSYDADRRIGDASTYDVTRDFSNSDIADTGTIAWQSSLAYYGSVKLVDLNRDGLTDICGRGPAGVYCAFSVGNGFAEKRLVLPDDFTDGAGWGVPDKGSTITFGDLNGNSRVDVCGRGYWGIVCAEGY